MKKIRFIFFAAIAIGVLISGKCNSGGNNPTSTTPPQGPMLSTTFSIPKINESNQWSSGNIDFRNGPCREIFDPSTFTVRANVMYQSTTGQQIYSFKFIDDVRIPMDNDFFLYGVDVPSSGEYWLHLVFSSDKCTRCCGMDEMDKVGFPNLGCDGTSLTGNIKQGKFVFECISTVATTSNPNPQFNGFTNIGCNCNCL